MSAPASPYTAAFLERLEEVGARPSAEAIVPIALDLVHPSSVVDVGCGLGSWLAVFREHGVQDILGIDGDYVERAQLRIPADRFLAHDLTRPLELGRTFDLAVSVEVAEHLPDASANAFVTSLTRLAPVILFSAAIPFQGGVHHVNLQWPDYWVAMFRERGFVAIDAIRPRVWRNPDVGWWYAQNSLVFAREAELSRYPPLREALARTEPERLALVHPRNYLDNATLGDHYVRQAPVPALLRAIPGAAVRAVRRRLLPPREPPSAGRSRDP